jgi:tellurite resistance protein
MSTPSAAPAAIPAPGLPRVPASFFGMVLGLAGLGGAWRAAAPALDLPPTIAESIYAVATLVWAILLVLFAAKWLLARDEAQAEASHPVQCCFIGLAGAATMLVGIGAAPYSRALGLTLVVLGSAFNIGFGIWRTGAIWRGGREPSAATPVLYLPTVAGGLVSATALSVYGYRDWGEVFFGAGLFSWLAIESVLVHRFYTAAPMAPALRPTLGIQLAPPPVCAVAYLAVNGGQPDLFAHALIGYGILQAAIALRMLPWVREQPFTASYWAYTFGLTALATAPLRMAAHGDAVMKTLAPWLFGFANLAVLLIALGTLRLMAQGRLLPAPVAKA